MWERIKSWFKMIFDVELISLYREYNGSIIPNIKELEKRREDDAKLSRVFLRSQGYNFDRRAQSLNNIKSFNLEENINNGDLQLSIEEYFKDFMENSNPFYDFKVESDGDKVIIDLGTPIDTAKFIYILDRVYMSLYNIDSVEYEVLFSHINERVYYKIILVSTSKALKTVSEFLSTLNSKIFELREEIISIGGDIKKEKFLNYISEFVEEDFKKVIIGRLKNFESYVENDIKEIKSIIYDNFTLIDLLVKEIGGNEDEFKDDILQ